MVGPIAYRTRDADPRWYVVWGMPAALREFITTHPAGATGKASNRRVEVVDLADAVPEGCIVFAHGASEPNWVGC